MFFARVVQVGMSVWVLIEISHISTYAYFLRPTFYGLWFKNQSTYFFRLRDTKVHVSVYVYTELFSACRLTMWRGHCCGQML